jgi:tRNA 2-thiouridine synthesizing protein A
MSSAPMTDLSLDLSGLKCPLPALKTRKALSGLMAGDRLTVTCTDPMSALDIPNLVRETGDRLEEQSGTDGAFVFRIQKSAP